MPRPMPAQRPPARQAGFALISALATLVVVSLIVTLVLAMSVSETQQSGSQAGLVRARAAGEAGKEAVVFYLANSGLADINAVLEPYAAAFANGNKDASTTPILSAGDLTSATASLRALAGLTQNGAVGGAAYQAKVQIESLQADESSFSRAGQDYFLRFRVNSLGTVGSFARTITAQGVLRIRLGRKYLNQYVLLADDGGYADAEPNYFATGTSYDGPVHVNKNVGFFGYPSFSEGFTTNAAKVGMSDCRNNDVMVNTQSGPDGCTAPDWGGKGISYVKPRVPLPQNSQSQQNAALGLDPSGAAPNASQICAALGVSGASCGATGPRASGVYLPRSGSVLTGGIYVQGDVKSLLLSVTPAPLSNQVYTLVDANNVVNVITVDATARTTTVKVGSGLPVVYAGVPNGQLYTPGNILGLGGPARTGPLPSPVPTDRVPAQVPPAVAPKSRLNISAEGDVVLSSDLTYSEDPRVVAGASNVLGVISGQGNVRIGAAAPADLYLHGAFLAGKDGHGFSNDAYNSGPPEGAIHLLGSVNESKDLARGYVFFDRNGKLTALNGYLDDFHFDTRFENGGLAPPYYPATTKFEAQSAYPELQAFREQ